MSWYIFFFLQLPVSLYFKIKVKECTSCLVHELYCYHIKTFLTKGRTQGQVDTHFYYKELHRSNSRTETNSFPSWSERACEQEGNLQSRQDLTLHLSGFSWSNLTPPSEFRVQTFPHHILCQTLLGGGALPHCSNLPPMCFAF